MENSSVYAISFLLTTIALGVLWFLFLHRRHFPSHMSDQEWRDSTEKIRAAIQQAEAPGSSAQPIPVGTKLDVRDRHTFLAGQIKKDIIALNDLTRGWYAQPRISSKAFNWLKREHAALEWAEREHLRVASLLDSGDVDAANYAMDRIDEDRRKSQQSLAKICGA